MINKFIMLMDFVRYPCLGNYLLPNSCTLKYVKFISNISHRLGKTNSWIFVTNTKNIITKCKNISKPIEIIVNGTGIFSLDIDCAANT